MSAVDNRVSAALAAVDAAERLPDGRPGLAAHPSGTAARIADDLHRQRIAGRRTVAIADALAHARRVLRAACEIRPTDERLADLRRIYATWPLNWKPRPQDVAAWRAKADVVAS